MVSSSFLLSWRSAWWGLFVSPAVKGRYEDDKDDEEELPRASGSTVGGLFVRREVGEQEGFCCCCLSFDRISSNWFCRRALINNSRSWSSCKTPILASCSAQRFWLSIDIGALRIPTSSQDGRSTAEFPSLLGVRLLARFFFCCNWDAFIASMYCLTLLSTLE